MCLSNVANQVEYLNMISNDENDDKPTAEGAARLDEALAEIGEGAAKRLEHDIRVDAAKLELFDKLVDAVDLLCRGYARIDPTWKQVYLRARALQRGDLP